MYNTDDFIKAKNSKGELFAVEVQRQDAGAKPKRARYISSLIDGNELIQLLARYFTSLEFMV